MPSVEDFLVDFSKEEETGGGGVRVPPDTYLVRIPGAKTGISEDKGTPYLEVIFAFKEGKLAKQKKKLAERLYNTPKAMRRFRLLLEAVGLKVPKKLDLTKLPAKLKGKELYIEVDDDEREGYSTRSRVNFEGFIGVDDYTTGEQDEDEDLEDEDELEDEEDEDLEDEDEDEEEEPPKRKRSKKSSTKSKKKNKRDKRDEDEDEDEEEEDEDEDLEDLDLDSM